MQGHPPEVAGRPYEPLALLQRAHEGARRAGFTLHDIDWALTTLRSTPSRTLLAISLVSPFALLVRLSLFTLNSGRSLQKAPQRGGEGEG